VNPVELVVREVGEDQVLQVLQDPDVEPWISVDKIFLILAMAAWSCLRLVADGSWDRIRPGWLF
jgi:hypothetical protein